MLLHEFLEESARTYPNKIALVQKEERWTYRAIDEKANQVAHLPRNQPPVSSAVHSQVIPGSEIDILFPSPGNKLPNLAALIYTSGSAENPRRSHFHSSQQSHGRRLDPLHIVPLGRDNSREKGEENCPMTGCQNPLWEGLEIPSTLDSSLGILHCGLAIFFND